MLQDRLVRPIGDLNHPTCFAHEVSAYRSRAEAEDDLLLALFHPQVTLRTEERAQARCGERVSTHASGPTKRHAARVRLPARRSHVRPQRHGKYRRQHTTSQIRLDGQALLDTSRRSPRRAPPSRAPCRTRPAAHARTRGIGWVGVSIQGLYDTHLAVASTSLLYVTAPFAQRGDGTCARLERIVLRTFELSLSTSYDACSFEKARAACSFPGFLSGCTLRDIWRYVFRSDAASNVGASGDRRSTS